jgi:hypothetical protein
VILVVIVILLNLPTLLSGRTNQSAASDSFGKCAGEAFLIISEIPTGLFKCAEQRTGGRRVTGHSRALTSCKLRGRPA